MISTEKTFSAIIIITVLLLSLLLILLQVVVVVVVVYFWNRYVNKKLMQVVYFICLFVYFTQNHG